LPTQTEFIAFAKAQFIAFTNGNFKKFHFSSKIILVSYKLKIANESVHRIRWRVPVTSMLGFNKMDIKFKEWEFSPSMASITNPSILLQESNDPVSVYILAFEANNNSNNFSVVEFFYEDSGLFKLHKAHINPYIKKLTPGKIYFCENSPAGNGHDKDHWLVVFDQSVYEIIGFNAAAHTIVAESSTDAIIKFIKSPNGNATQDATRL
jgi:hypothetical protein